MVQQIQTEGPRERSITIDAGKVKLRGILSVPDNPIGIVLFAHGSGSGRLSPRNRFVAWTLQNKHLGTLLMDLLEEREEDDRNKVFDIDLLASRLNAAIDWIKREPKIKSLPIGLFGASTGAAVALKVAARMGSEVGAVVSRGGRPDLAKDALEQVSSPTLLIVGGDDSIVIELNEYAYSKLRSKKDLIIIPGATHLFEESGKLEEVARLAGEWFARHLNKSIG